MKLFVGAAELIPKQQQLVAIRGVLSKGLQQIFVKAGKPLTALGGVAKFCVCRS